ncbi:MAG: hypothetical protein KC418_17465 [Anaerolineales bacterium]|nr:hypothetical protein [Anaerolineales bacterium]
MYSLNQLLNAPRIASPAAELTHSSVVNDKNLINGQIAHRLRQLLIEFRAFAEATTHDLADFGAGGCPGF